MARVTALLRAGLRPPALLIALAGALLVVGTQFLPFLAAFGSSWYVLAGLTLAGWVALAATQVESGDMRPVRYSRSNPDPYMVRALERRDALASEVRELASATLRGEADLALERVDHDLLPELEARVRRHRALEDSLRQHATGRGPLAGASAANIARLTDLASQQRQALEGALAQLSDMTASLMGLSQEGDQSALVERAREWADDLGAYWEATEEVFRSSRVTPDVGGRT